MTGVQTCALPIWPYCFHNVSLQVSSKCVIQLSGESLLCWRRYLLILIVQTILQIPGGHQRRVEAVIIVNYVPPDAQPLACFDSVWFDYVTGKPIFKQIRFCTAGVRRSKSPEAASADRKRNRTSLRDVDSFLCRKRRGARFVDRDSNAAAFRVQLFIFLQAVHVLSFGVVVRSLWSSDPIRCLSAFDSSFTGTWFSSSTFNDHSASDDDDGRQADLHSSLSNVSTVQY